MQDTTNSRSANKAPGSGKALESVSTVATTARATDSKLPVTQPSSAQLSSKQPSSAQPWSGGAGRLRISWRTVLSFYLLLMLITWFLDWGEFTTNVDQLVHDSWVRLSQRDAPEDIVIVGIDPASLDTLGRWPWPRTVQARLFNKLSQSGIKAAALDLLYVEPDDLAVSDKLLADAISRLPIAILPVLTEVTAQREVVEKLPIPQISRHAEAIGHIVTPMDSDGIVRRVNLKSGFSIAHWSQLALALSRALDGAPSEESLPGKRLNESADVHGWIGDWEVLIPFWGPAGTFNNVSVLDLMNDQIDPDVLKDKIVFVGMTTTGLGDMLPTAVSAKSRPMPGVEIHANIFAALRDGSLITEIDNRFNFVVAGALIGLLLLLYFNLSPLWSLISAAGIALVPIALSFFMYRSMHLWYAPLEATLPLLISYFLWSWHRLEFVADFLRDETHKLTRDVEPLPSPDNERLAEFFGNAAQHLPLNGWHFSAMGQQFSGGELPEPVPLDASVGQWVRQGTTYSKRYPTQGKLEIGLVLDKSEIAVEMMDYVDSLSRVKERQRLGRMSGTLERMQSNTYELSLQLDRLRQMNGLSESIFAGSSAGLAVWSASGEPVRINALATEMMPEILDVNLTLHQFLRRIGRDPDQRDLALVNDLVLRRVPWQINLVEDDTEIVINFSAVGDTLADRLISASIIDVSDIRRSERSRAEMVDFLSHDLRAPLISSLYLLKGDDVEGESKDSGKIDRIEHNINHSLKMIDDLLTIARADNIKTDNFVQVLFESIVDNAIDQLSPQARNKGIDFEVTSENDELWIECDASLVERALVNIISNSIKYSDANTTVKIETLDSTDSVIFRVADQGVGIAPEMMESLFQRFRRDKKISQKYEGIGLGLALVARVVSQHGGEVRAKSPGKGTIIEVELPLLQHNEQTAESGD